MYFTKLVAHIGGQLNLDHSRPVRIKELELQFSNQVERAWIELQGKDPKGRLHHFVVHVVAGQWFYEEVSPHGGAEEFVDGEFLSALDKTEWSQLVGKLGNPQQLTVRLGWPEPCKVVVLAINQTEDPHIQASTGATVVDACAAPQ